MVASSSNGSHPQTAIGNRAHRGHGQVMIWNYNESCGLFEAQKTLIHRDWHNSWWGNSASYYTIIRAGCYSRTSYHLECVGKRSNYADPEAAFQRAGWREVCLPSTRTAVTFSDPEKRSEQRYVHVWFKFMFQLPKISTYYPILLMFCWPYMFPLLKLTTV